MNQLMETADHYLLHTYNRFPVVLERGDGVYLYDDTGKKYLDFAAGIAVFSLGYNNKEFNDALKYQVDQLLHTSNLFYNIPLADAAKKLSKASGFERVFFTNSGTEAMEGAIKLARKYAFKKYNNSRNEIISMEQSFHGRSLGALAVTGQPKYLEAFGPLMDGVKFAKFNQLTSVLELISDKTSAIIVEPIQGEGGIHPAQNEFLQGLRDICDEHDITLIFDEIQCGMGRTGSMFAWQHYGVKPDIITTAKALGCGVPVGALAASAARAEAMEPGDHGTTYGGNPFTMCAVSKVFDLYEQLNLLEHVNQISEYFIKKLEDLKEKYSFIIERRGIGLMQGLELNQLVNGFVMKALEKGLVIISAGSNVIRFVPPLVITKANVDEMISILESCFCE